jgi:hypothetical protein
MLECPIVAFGLDAEINHRRWSRPQVE